MREALARWLVSLSAAVSTACALRSGVVTRVADGREFEARAISAEAYGAYARGALLESAGDDQNALAAYEDALAEDSDSPEILARIGATRCRLARSPNDAVGRAATQSLARATELDSLSSSAWTETAHCLARRGQLRQAFEAALRAAGADPVAIGSALLVSSRAEAAGELGLARSWLDELVARAPDSREAWLAFAGFAARQADLGRELRARAGLAALGLGTGPSPARDLDAALSQGNLAAARAAAIRLRLGAGELAARLLERGLSEAAMEQASLVSNADPEDVDAWVAGLVSADLRQDRRELERALHAVPTAPSAMSPLAVRLHAELLERVVGPDARAAWLAAQPVPH
jgi:hypothetical protein